LSLPDSELLLDGLTFFAKVDSDKMWVDNPLTLAFESMRGRPSILFMGTVKLEEVEMDVSGSIIL
jgi:hypothetical protein